MNKIEALKQMWKEVFGDTEAYLQMFFETIYQEENTLMIREQEELVAMLYMIPYTIRLNGKEQEGLYLYALATKEEKRKNGYMTSLIKKANQLAKDRGALFTFLQPACEALYPYYENRGFKEVVWKTYLEISWEVIKQFYQQSQSNDKQISIQTLPLQDYVAQEIKMDSGKNIVWSPMKGLWFYQTFQMEGAESIVLQYENRKLYFILQYMPEEQKLIIWISLGVRRKDILNILYELRKKYVYNTLIWEEFNYLRDDNCENYPWKTFLKSRKSLMINSITENRQIDWNKIQFKHVLQ